MSIAKLDVTLDITPTLVELAGGTWPIQPPDKAVLPSPGKSLTAMLDVPLDTGERTR